MSGLCVGLLSSVCYMSLPRCFGTALQETPHLTWAHSKMKVWNLQSLWIEECIQSHEQMWGSLWHGVGRIRSSAKAGAGAGRAKGAGVASARCRLSVSAGVILSARELSQSASHLLIIDIHGKFCHTSSSGSYRKGFFVLFEDPLAVSCQLTGADAGSPARLWGKAAAAAGPSPGPVAVLISRCFRSRKLCLWS